MSPHTDPGALLKLLQASSCFRGDVCHSLPCACAESLARQAASQGSAGGEEPMAYWFEHPTFGMELSLDQLSEEGVKRGWVETPLYAHPAQASRPRAFLSWAVEMFGPVAKLRSERLLRFVEEAIELAHAEGMEREVFNKVADRVYSRPAGDTPKEIGQAQACLETFAENIGLSSDEEAEREWQRVQEIPQEEWTRRHSAKQALGIALPSASRGTEA